MNTRRALLVVVCTVALATPLLLPAPSPVGPPVEQGFNTNIESGIPSQESGNVTVELTRLPNQTIRAEFDVDESTSNFGLSGARGLRWVKLDGFQSSLYGGPVWNSSNRSPTAIYSYPAGPPEVSRFGMQRGGYFNESSWALAPSFGVDGETATIETTGEGTVVGQFVYFGAYERWNLTVEQQHVRFVAAKNSGFRYHNTRQAIMATGFHINFSEPQREVPFVILPRQMENVAGFTSGISRSGQPTVVVGKPSWGRNNWFERWRAPVVAAHEYVHTFQSHWRPQPNTAWIREAAAVYYSVEPLYRSGVLSDEAYRVTWAMRRSQIKPNAVLSDSSTWTQSTPYSRGAFVLAGLDKRIRTATNESASLQTVLQEVEMSRNPSLEDMNTTIRQVADAETAEWFMLHSTTSKLPNTAETTDGSLANQLFWRLYLRLGRGPVWIQLVLFPLLGLMTAESIVGGVEKTRNLIKRIRVEIP